MAQTDFIMKVNGSIMLPMATAKPNIMTKVHTPAILREAKDTEKVISHEEKSPIMVILWKIEWKDTEFIIHRHKYTKENG